MRKHSYHWLQQAVFLLLAAPLMMGLSACSDDDDVVPAEEEMTEEEKAVQEQMSKYDAMNSVVRALAEIDELPDDWETAVFKAGVGKVLDEAYPDVRSVAAESVEGAVSYFMSITPDDEVEETVTGYTWKHDGVGQLTLVRTGSDNCFATIQVNLPQMPDLKEIRLVPAALLADNAAKPPYYHMGDVVTDEKGIYWICIRPADRARGKDKVYFASFDERLIKTKKIKVKMYDYDLVDKEYTKNQVSTSGEWVYGTNLLEERMAIAAGHTFTLLSMEQPSGIEQLHHCFDVGLALETLADLDLYELRYLAGTHNQEYNTYMFAYGSHKSNSYKRYSQVAYLQPVLTVASEIKDGRVREIVTKYVTSPEIDKVGQFFSEMVMSLTADYDPSYPSIHRFWKDDWHNDDVGIHVPYNIKNYCTLYEKGNANNLAYNIDYVYYRNIASERVLVMTQMSFKDSGSKDKKLTDVWHSEAKEAADYWETLEVTDRYITKKAGPMSDYPPEENIE